MHHRQYHHQQEFDLKPGRPIPEAGPASQATIIAGLMIAAGRVGAQHVLNAEYFKRIDALNYTMMHDDGQHVEGLEEADMVLVGVSRTSKTPTSIYLAGLIRTLLGRVAIAYCARHDQGR